MFCPKCGTKAIEGAEFCQKCGAKLITDSAVQPTPISPVQHIQSQSADLSAKKKSKKLPIILGAVVLVVAAIIFIVLNREDKIDYEANVRAYTPYANSQGLPYTCGEVFDKYIPDAKWTVREEGKDAAVVDVSGTPKGMDTEIRISLRMEINGDQFLVRSISVDLDGEDVSEDVFFAFFVAYDEKLGDLSSLNQLLSGEIELTEEYTDEAEGFSFNHPSDWTFNDMVDYGTYTDQFGFTPLCQIAQYSPYTVIAVYKSSDAGLVEAFSDETEFLTAFGYAVEAVSEIELSAADLDGIPAKRISYVMMETSSVQDYIYIMGGTVYKVQLTCAKDTAGSNAALFTAIMDSYTITNGTPAAANQLLFRGIPVEDIIGAHSSDIIAFFGEPAMYTENFELDYSPMVLGMYFGLTDGDIVDFFLSVPSDFTYNGQSLDQDFDSLVAILGDNYTNMGGTAHSWEVTWPYGDCQIDINIPQDETGMFSVRIMKV